MVIGRTLIVSIFFITLCITKTIQYPRDHIIPPDSDHFRKRTHENIVSNPPRILERITTTTTAYLSNEASIPSVPFHDIIFRFSNVGLRKIGPDFIVSDKIISLSLDNNEINYISPHAFRGMRNLRYLNLSGNKIPTERLLLLTKVAGLQTLIIDNNNPMDSIKIDEESDEQTVNYGMFETLQHLHMSNSQLKDFPVYLNAPILSHLYLSNNSIQSSDIFNKIPNTLRYLRLDNNRINQIEEHKLGYLEELNMDNNIITEVCLEQCNKNFISLRGANNMKTLSLSRNKISKISADAFRDTQYLSNLDLSKNNILEVMKGTFNNRSIPWIKKISLADNNLTSIPDVCSLGYLITLNLNGNHIHTIKNFCTMYSLENLYLANNNMSIIESRAFVNLPKLKYLDLSHNQLKHLPEHWVSVWRLEELHLENNYFEKISHLALLNMNALKNIYLDENPMLSLQVLSLKSLPVDLTIHVKNMRFRNSTNNNDNNDDNDDNDDNKSTSKSESSIFNYF